jgi:hypothetical protein
MGVSSRSGWAELLSAAALGAALGAALALRLRGGTDRAWPLRRAPRRLGGVCRLKPDMFEQYTRVSDERRQGEARARADPKVLLVASLRAVARPHVSVGEARVGVRSGLRFGVRSASRRRAE